MSALFLLASGLISFDMPLLERQKLLAPYFSPAPGNDLTVDARALALVRGKDALLTKGQLWVKPPKGTCLTVRSVLTKYDKKFCRDSVYTWDPFDLDGAGRLHLTIVTGPKDEGTPLTWTTPYRIANYVPIDNEEDNVNVPILSCKTSIDQDTRKITLKLMDGRQWFIYLPEYDRPITDNAPPPNLIVRIDSKKEVPGKPAAAGAGHEAEEAPKKAVSALSQLLSGAYKDVKVETQGFHVPKRNAYEMSSSHFMETSVPQGMGDRCRYMFLGAPGDQGSGVIECFNTDSLASVYAPVTCFSEFSPRLDPNAKAPPKEGK